MTATARVDNVTYVAFPAVATPLETSDPRWPRAGGADVEAAPGKTPAATGPIPARWNPRAGITTSHAWRRFRRSQLHADLRDWARLVLFGTAFVCGLVIVDHIHALITGGTR